MELLFTKLTQAVEGAPIVAVAAATVWGMLSILLSPCHLASIPLIVGFMDGREQSSTRRAFTISGMFAMGILLTIALVGAITAAAGRMLGDVGPWANYFVAAVFFLVGLQLLGVMLVTFGGAGQVRFERKGALAALALGLVFGVALGPCTFAYMAPMLAVSFKLGAADVVFGAMLLLAYGVGHCAVIVVAGTSAALVQRYLNWTERSQGALIVRRICGVLVLAAGVYLIYVAP